jgi:hypothetical protein
MKVCEKLEVEIGEALTNVCHSQHACFFILSDVWLFNWGIAEFSGSFNYVTQN